MKPPRNRTHDRRYQDARHRLRQAFPELFAIPRHPWKIGIWRDIAKLRPDIMYNRWVSWYIQDFTRGEKYLMSVINGMPRIDVNGVIVEDIKPEHQEYARMLMEKKNG